MDGWRATKESDSQIDRRKVARVKRWTGAWAERKIESVDGRNNE